MEAIRNRYEFVILLMLKTEIPTGTRTREICRGWIRRRAMAS